MITGTAAFRWREDDSEFVDGVMEDLRELGLRPGINTLFDVTKAAPSMSSHTITFEVNPWLVDRAAGVLAGIADAGGRVMIALDGAQQKGID